MTDRQIQWPDAPIRRPKPLISDVITWPSGLAFNERLWYWRVWQYDENAKKMEVREDLVSDSKFEEEHCPNGWTCRPGNERTCVGYVRSSYRRMEESREKEGRVTLANWKRLLRLHFMIRMLGKDGTFRWAVYKEKYKKLLTEIGFEVIRLLEKP